MVMCDLSPDIIKWGYEQHIIPYYLPTDKKVHRYIIDFWIEKKDNKKYLIELKPDYKLRKPTPSKKTTLRTLSDYQYEVLDYIKNQMKWKFAKEFVKKINCEFIIITDKDLKKVKI